MESGVLFGEKIWTQDASVKVTAPPAGIAALAAGPDSPSKMIAAPPQPKRFEEAWSKKGARIGDGIGSWMGLVMLGVSLGVTGFAFYIGGPTPVLEGNPGAPFLTLGCTLMISSLFCLGLVSALLRFAGGDLGKLSGKWRDHQEHKAYLKAKQAEWMQRLKEKPEDNPQERTIEASESDTAQNRFKF